MSAYTAVVAHGLFPAQEHLKRHATVRFRRALEQSQWWSADELRALQLERLRGLLGAASRRVPAYRRLLGETVEPGDIQSLRDLQGLPVTDKPIIRAAGPDWRAEGVSGLVQQQTSGSSGEPLAFWLSRDRIAMDVAAKWRATRWWGVDIGDREAVVWGSGIENAAQNLARGLRDRLFRSRLFPAHGLSAQRQDEMLGELAGYRPRMLFGYPSVLARLAWRARETGFNAKAVGVRVAFTTSEVLRPEWRQVIEAVFGCAVCNEYGARDAGFIARECPEGHLHVTAEELIVEVVDEHGRPVPPGEQGELLVTNLFSAGFPFIRYRTGDYGRLSADPCPCGRGLPVLEELAGRANDGLLARNGAWVHGSAFNYLMRGIPGLRAYKIVQESLEHVDVMLDVEGELDAALPQRVQAGLRRHLGEEVAVVVRQVDTVPPEPNGKFRHVVCRVAHSEVRG